MSNDPIIHKDKSKNKGKFQNKCGQSSVVSHLYSVLGQLRLHGKHLPGVDIRVVRLVEGLLQLLQLVGGEHRPAGQRTECETETLMEHRTDRRTGRRTDRRTGRRTDWRADRRTDRRTGRRADRRTDRRADRRTGRRTDRRADRRTDRRTGRRADRRTDRRTGRRTDRRADRRTGRRTDRRTDNMEVWCHKYEFYFQLLNLLKACKLCLNLLFIYSLNYKHIFLEECLFSIFVFFCICHSDFFHQTEYKDKNRLHMRSMNLWSSVHVCLRINLFNVKFILLSNRFCSDQ